MLAAWFVGYIRKEPARPIALKQIAAIDLIDRIARAFWAAGRGSK
jgi:hypothetical protein